MLYRFEVQYWSYEQALELPFGLPCCRSNGVLPSCDTEAHNDGRPAGWAGGGKEKMDSIQNRVLARIETMAKDADLEVSQDASYSNVGTLRFHVAGEVAPRGKVRYSFQPGYAQFSINDGPDYSYGYDDGKRTLDDFLTLLADQDW